MGNNKTIKKEIKENNFKAIIENIAAKKKITLYNVAKHSGVAMSNIYRWNQHEPNIVELYKVSQYLEIPMENIIKEYLK